jgi:hypothetical protein
MIKVVIQLHLVTCVLLTWGCTNRVDDIDIFLSESVIESVKRGEENLLEQIEHGIDETSSVCRGRDIDMYNDLQYMEAVVMRNNFYKDSIYGSQMFHQISMDEAYEKIALNNQRANLRLLDVTNRFINNIHEKGELSIDQVAMRLTRIQETYDSYRVKDYNLLVRNISDLKLGVAAIHLYYLNQREVLVDEMLSFTRGKRTGYDQIVYPQMLNTKAFDENKNNQVEFVLAVRDFSIDNSLIYLAIGSDTIKADESNKVTYNYIPNNEGVDSIETTLLIKNPITGLSFSRDYVHSFLVK